MTCEEFQSWFPELFDTPAPAASGQALNEHLAHCPRCRHEFADLLECRRLIASLPQVDPPPGFATRVMAHVSDTGKRPTYWQRLFLPFSIKIPLHAAAVVLIAIMSVYVYQKEEQQHVPPRTVAAPQPPLETQADANTIQNSRPSSPSESERSAEQKPPQDLRKRPRRPESLPSKPPQIAKATESRLGSSGEMRSHPPIRAQGVIATMGPSAPAAFRDPGFRPFSGARGFPNLGEPVADYELVVRRREARQGVRKTATEESPREENSTTAQLEPMDSASAVEIQWYVIARERYDDFKKEVSARATIESENAIGASDRQGSFRSDGPFYIKVLVLAPLDR